MTGYLKNIEEITLANEYFRQVLYTGQHIQLVVMSLGPNEEIGQEVHRTNVINTSTEKSLKLYTIYSPPHHKNGVVHKTKQEAESDLV